MIVSFVNAVTTWTWNNSAGGAWTTAANWTSSPITAGTPVTGDNVIFPVLSGAYLITAVPAISLNNITINSNTVVELNSAVNLSIITCTGAFTVNSGATFHPGFTSGKRLGFTISGSATCEIYGTGTFNFDAGGTSLPFEIDGILQIDNGGTLTDGNGGTGSDVEVFGTLNMLGNAVISTGGVVYVESGGTLNMNSTSTISNAGKFIVYSGGTLVMSPNTIVENTSTFNVNSGGLLEIGSTAGITTSGATGNVQSTSTRTYSSGANYIYNGTSGAQVTGNGLNQNTPANLTINNSSGVTLTAATQISGILTLSSGVLTTTAANLLTITTTSPYAISGESTSSFINGPLAWTLASGQSVGSFVFPVGVVGAGTGPYFPLTLTNPNTSGSMTLTVTANSGSTGGSAGASLSGGISSTEYWAVAAATKNLSSGTISLERQTSIAGIYNAIGEATSKTGTYSTYYGTVSGSYDIVNSTTFSVNSANTVYFLMAAGASPTVTTPTVTSITGTNAVLGGDLTAIGSSNVTDEGIYYSTASFIPPGAATKVSIISSTSYNNGPPGPFSTGTFIVPVTGLTSGSQTYYYCAYATNSNGTSYTTVSSFTTGATPKTWYVNDGSTTGDIYCTAIGSNSNAGTSAAPFATLTYALSKASAGDNIYVDAGTWTHGAATYTTPEKLTINLAGISIIGARSSGTNLTIFNEVSDADENWALQITANNVTLQNLIIENYGYDASASSNGLALTIGDNTNTYTGILVKYVETNGNGGSDDNGSGGIEILGKTTATIAGGATVCDNTAQDVYAGGISINGKNINLTITNYVIGYNNSNDDNYGGMWLINGDATQNVTIKNTYFEYNNYSKSTTMLGGADIYMTTGNLTVQDCLFDHAYSENDGGGSYYGGSITVTGGTALITRSKFTNNSIKAGASGYGGAIAVTGGIVTIDSCSFSGNSADDNGIDIVTNGGASLVFNSTFTASSTNVDKIAGNINVAYSGTSASIFSGTLIPATASLYTPNPSLPTLSGSCPTITYTPLPIQLTMFEGECSDNKVQIIWQTASETNNNYFTIEKSTDDYNWDIVATVPGAGNSNEVLNYTVMDEETNIVLHYYRLKQTDFNGQYTYSDIIAVASCLENEFDIVVATVPVHNNMNIMINANNSQKALLSVKDVLGRSIIEREVEINGNTSLIIDVSALSNGIYFVGMVSENYSKNVIREILINN